MCEWISIHGTIAFICSYMLAPSGCNIHMMILVVMQIIIKLLPELKLKH